MGPSATVQSTLAACDAVVFDVDSTVQPHEGIDRLAAACGCAAAVQRLTRDAMQGGMLFEDALRLRLELMRPSRQQVEEVASMPPEITPGVVQVIERFRALKKDVFLVSGGFSMMIAPLAAVLGIADDHVFANELLFDDSGSYRGFSHNQPTSRSGGKRRVIESIMKQYGYRNVVMIGDGATDVGGRFAPRGWCIALTTIDEDGSAPSRVSFHRVRWYPGSGKCSPGMRLVCQGFRRSPGCPSVLMSCTHRDDASCCNIPSVLPLHLASDRGDL